MYRRRRTGGALEETSAEDVHDAYLAAETPFDVYSSPFEGGRLPGYGESWRVDGAAASVWSNAGILEEVLEGLPWQLGALRSITHAPLVDRRAWPPLPQPGDAIRSWSLFDASARDPSAALELVGHVNDLALEVWIDWCYVITVPGG